VLDGQKTADWLLCVSHGLASIRIFYTQAVAKQGGKECERLNNQKVVGTVVVIAASVGVRVGNKIPLDVVGVD